MSAPSAEARRAGSGARPDPTATTVLTALDQRLVSAAAALLPDEPAPTGPEGTAAAVLLPRLIEACPPDAGPEHWLLLTCVLASFPVADEIEQLARDMQLRSPDAVAEDLLEQALDLAPRGRLDLTVRLVSDAVVVDTDYCARHDTHTGIQRVVRETVPRWAREHPIVLVAALTERSAYRSLRPSETTRVMDFPASVAPGSADDDDAEIELVVPWRTTVLWPEVLDPHCCLWAGALAQYSGNEVGLIAYDMIPELSTELRPFGESGIFARFLSAVKWAHRVAGISNSATVEFAGFGDMLAAQGLEGPTVREVELPEDIGQHEFPPPGTYRTGRPTMLVTGRREPHKNVRAALQAAERLWREGLDFEVVMLGGRGWDERRLTETMDRLKAEGRPLTTLGWVSDEEMWGRIRDADFVVFASLHEGYGLPISEALACGTPVVTTHYGSQREVGEKGGCLLVDPRDDTAITDAVRQLLTSPEHLERLRAEIPGRPRRSWDDYARESWAYLVEGTS